MSEGTQAIEARMLMEVRAMVAENRANLDFLDVSLRERMASILGYGPLSTEAWLVTPCSYLGARRPIDVLADDSERVFAAAKRRAEGAEGAEHG